MARGGYRPGSGPAKGTKYAPRGKRTPAKKKGEIPPDIVAEAKAENLTPLDYMLRVMNSPDEPKERRDRMAVAAAPFCHARKGEGTGKKDEKNEAARRAGTGKFAAGRPPLAVVK
jgi:hypothetical protein